MKKSVLISSLFVAAAFVSQSALAEVKIRAGTGSSTYTLSGDYLTGGSTYHPTNFGVTFSSDTAANGAYLDLSYSSGTGHTDVRNNYPIPSPSESFKRDDAALTGGVVFLNQNNGVAGNVYVGIKTGKTTLGCGISCTTRTWETFTTTGVVFGGGASFPVAGGRAGSVGVNLGLGFMGDKWVASEGKSSTANYALGGSLGASYTFPFTHNFGATADYKYQSYSYSFGTGGNFKVNEKISAFGLSLYAKF